MNSIVRRRLFFICLLCLIGVDCERCAADSNPAGQDAEEPAAATEKSRESSSAASSSSSCRTFTCG